MKKQDITYQDKLNELRLDISHPNNKGIAFVFLEGESDIRIFRKLFNLDKCKVETIPGGKFNLEKCVGELVVVYSLIIGIRDADFLHLGSQPYLKANMFLTDLHDMEMMIISEDEVFSALIFEYTSLIKDKHSEARNNIMLVIEQISLLRWLNEKENLEYTFDAGFQDLISFANLKIDFNQYFSRVISKSPKAKLTDLTEVLKKMKDLKNINPDSSQLCNGHDFMKALSLYVKESGEGRALSDESISSSFRMTYNINHFKKTMLFNVLKSWSDSTGCVLYN